jgi:hypothetical protein
MTAIDEMVVETPEGPVALPALFHFTETRMVALADGTHGIFAFGHEVSLTAEMVEASRGRFGDSTLLDRVRTGDGIHPGPWPEGKLRFQPGSFDHREARERARQEAHAERDPQVRAELLAKVREDYGDEVTSRTLSTKPPVGEHG